MTTDIETELFNETVGPERRQSPIVSVIVAVKEGEEAACVPSLKKQSYERPFEILVVEGGNRSQAKNLGIAQSKAPLIVFIDADCEAPYDWLSCLVATLAEDGNIAGAGGVSETLSSLPDSERAIDGVFSTYLGSLDSPSLVSLASPRKSYAKAISGHNGVFRREVLVDVGGFDERFILNEDTDLSTRLRDLGYRLVVDHRIFVYHKRRKTIGSFARQFFWFGVGRMRTMLTRKANVDKRIFGLFLATVFLMLMTASMPVVSAVALLVYLALVLGSSIVGARRIRSLRVLPRMLVLFIVEHFSYLIGLVSGTFLGPWGKVMPPQSIRIQRYSVSPRVSSS